MKNSAKNNLQQTYERLEETPSATLWEKIENGLPKEEFPAEVSLPKRNYWKIAALVLLLISMGFLTHFLLNSTEEMPASSTIVSHQKEQKMPTSTQQEMSTETQRYSAEIQNSNQDEQLSKTNTFDSNTEKYSMQNHQQDKTVLAVEYSTKKALESDSQKTDVVKKEPEILANSTPAIKKEKVKYVTAEDLLFEREAKKSLKEQDNDSRKLGDLGAIKINTPKEVKILGITVYSEEQP